MLCKLSIFKLFRTCKSCHAISTQFAPSTNAMCHPVGSGFLYAQALQVCTMTDNLTGSIIQTWCTLGCQSAAVTPTNTLQFYHRMTRQHTCLSTASESTVTPAWITLAPLRPTQPQPRLPTQCAPPQPTPPSRQGGGALRLRRAQMLHTCGGRTLEGQPGSSERRLQVGFVFRRPCVRSFC